MRFETTNSKHSAEYVHSFITSSSSIAWKCRLAVPHSVQAPETAILLTRLHRYAHKDVFWLTFVKHAELSSDEFESLDESSHVLIYVQRWAHKMIKLRQKTRNGSSTLINMLMRWGFLWFRIDAELVSVLRLGALSTGGLITLRTSFSLCMGVRKWEFNPSPQIIQNLTVHFIADIAHFWVFKSVRWDWNIFGRNFRM